MDENQQTDSKESKSPYAPVGEYVTSSSWRAVVVFAIIGFLVSNTFGLTMNSETWFWFFSSIAQTFAALVALVAIFLIFRLELYNSKIDNYLQMLRQLIPEFRKDRKFDYLTIDELVLTLADGIIKELRAENFTTPLAIQSLYLMKARADIDKLEAKKKQAKKQMWILLENTIIIIMLSITLLPFGSPTIEDSLLFSIWVDYKLKWVLIFGVAGLCVSALYRVESLLNDTLSEKE